MILSDEVTILKMPAKKGSVLTDMSRNKATPKNNELISSQNWVVSLFCAKFQSLKIEFSRGFSIGLNLSRAFSIRLHVFVSAFYQRSVIFTLRHKC